MKPWTTDEDARLREAYPRLLNTRLAELFGRSESSVQSRARTLGLKKDLGALSERGRLVSAKLRGRTRNAAAWTADEDQFVLERHAMGQSSRSMAREIGRSADAILYRLRLLNGGPLRHEPTADELRSEAEHARHMLVEALAHRLASQAHTNRAQLDGVMRRLVALRDAPDAFWLRLARQPVSQFFAEVGLSESMTAHAVTVCVSVHEGSP